MEEAEQGVGEENAEHGATIAAATFRAGFVWARKEACVQASTGQKGEQSVG